MGAAFLVPLALSAASGAAQYVNQKGTQNRQNSALVQSLADQQADRAQANGAVNKLTSQIATDNPSTLAAKATGAYVDTLRKNAAGSTQGGSTTGDAQTFGGSVSSLPGVAGASDRYNAGTAASQKEVQDYGNTFAKNMGDIDAATRQRQNEGLQMQDLSTTLNQINQKSYGQNFVDQLRTQAAGQLNPWVSLGSSMLSGASSVLSKNPSAYFGGGGDGVNVAGDMSGLNGNASTMTNPFDTIGGPINARGMFKGAPLPLSAQATNWNQ